MLGAVCDAADHQDSTEHLTTSFCCTTECSQITNSGVITVASLMKVSRIEGTNIFQMDDQLAMKIIGIIGCTPIRNKDYDPGCMISFVGGMINGLKSFGDKNKCLFTILQFIENADCVDKGIITEIIDFGINHTKANDYGTVEYLVKISFSMLWTKQEASEPRCVSFLVEIKLVKRGSSATR